MKLLVDTNVLLEIMLEQEKAQDARTFLAKTEAAVEDMEGLIEVALRFDLDFDDAYQYTSAEKYDLAIVSFDSDFDRTQRGRKMPAEVLQE